MYKEMNVKYQIINRIEYRIDIQTVWSKLYSATLSTFYLNCNRNHHTKFKTDRIIL